MTEGDGPPVFLPEPPRPPAAPPAAEAPEPQPQPAGTPVPGSGRRLEEVPRRRGMPTPVLAFILAVTLVISIKESSIFPVLIGAALFLFLRRRGRR